MMQVNLNKSGQNYPVFRKLRSVYYPMHKLKALLIAVCLVLAIIILNIPNINFGLGA